MKLRLIEEIGRKAWLRIYWGGCPKGGVHNAMKHLADSPDPTDYNFAGTLEDYPDQAAWPTHCEDCGAQVPEGSFLNRSHEHNQPIYQVFTRRLYKTASGQPEPGDVFWATWYHGEHRRGYCPWDNCDDPRGHLMVVLPTGHHWDVDGRAGNCTMKDDRAHRCWVRHGEPPNLHVDKNGHTCSAGAGSIGSPGYHGFLHHGHLTNC